MTHNILFTLRFELKMREYYENANQNCFELSDDNFLVGFVYTDHIFPGLGKIKKFERILEVQHRR